MGKKTVFDFYTYNQEIKRVVKVKKDRLLTDSLKLTLAMETQTIEVDFIDIYSGTKTRISYG
jgi:hypothetical protein